MKRVEEVAATSANYGATASGSSFYAAMRILPRAQREAMFQIYSFCRQVDDIADSRIPDASYDGIYCVSILEHVPDVTAAARHLHRLLAPGGEIVVYVPFVYPFHDRGDHHRFTFTELARLMAPYAEFRLCPGDRAGYGGVLLDVLTFHQAHRWHGGWIALSSVLNALLAVPLAAAWLATRRSPRWGGVAWRDFRWYFTHLHLAHGFWAWGRK